MSKTNQIDNSYIGKWPDPISFLKDYINFAINARSRVITMLNKTYTESKDIYDKKMIWLLSFEQYLFHVETLLAFLNIAIHKSPVDLAMWTLWFNVEKRGKKRRKTFSFGELYKEIGKISERHIYQIYEKEFPSYKDEEIDIVVQSIIGIKNWLTASKIKETIVPFNNALNRLKHKFLAYRFKNGVALLLAPDIEKKSQKLSVGYGENEDRDLSYMVNFVNDVSIRIDTLIRIIIKRLEKKNANKWLSGPGKNAPLFTLCFPKSP